MRQAARTARYDQALGLEAYSLRAVDRPFPSHFHDHYVIGVVERGTRTLTCGRQRQVIGPGDVLLFNPGDSHACIQADGSLDYRGLNIPRSTMLALAEEIMGSRAMPGFSVAVVRDGELAGRLRALHRAVLGEEPELQREEALLLAWGLLLPGYAGMVETVSACRVEVERTCAFIRSHYARHITLEELSLQAGLSKSALVRAFAKAKGVTPYRYLMAVRISEARRLLERGVSSAEAAVETGFSDQSHFTNYFTAFTGLTPGACRELFRQEWERG